MELTCEQLGITPDDIADRVAKKIAETMLVSYSDEYDDETGETVQTDLPSKFQTLVRARVEAKVSAAVDAISERVVGGMVEERLTALTFPQTNGYGERKGEPLTLLEFIARRADTYLSEQVDSEGRAGRDCYGSARNPRVVWMLEKWLASRIKDDMERALKNANAKIVGGIEEVVKANLADIANRLSAQVVVKSKA